MGSRKPTMIAKNCTICGQPFEVVAMKRAQKTCLSQACRFEAKSRSSSSRMKERRNGGDPELNAKLAKAAGAHFRRLWKNPEFRKFKSEQGRQALMAYLADPVAAAKHSDRMSKLMTAVQARLLKETDFVERISESLSREMREDPYMPNDDRQYGEYLSEVCTRAHSNPEHRAWLDAKMAQLIKEQHAFNKAEKARQAYPLTENANPSTTSTSQ